MSYKRKELFAKVAEVITEVPKEQPAKEPVIEQKREPVRAIDIDLPDQEPAQQAAARKNH